MKTLFGKGLAGLLVLAAAIGFGVSGYAFGLIHSQKNSEHDLFQARYYKVRLIEETANVKDAEARVRDLERKNVELQVRLANMSNGPPLEELAVGK